MSEHFLMKGNEAVAEAAIRAGCRCYFGYPITPQTEIAAYMSKHMKQSGGVFLQAESKWQQLTLVLGAACSSRARAMTLLVLPISLVRLISPILPALICLDQRSSVLQRCRSGAAIRPPRLMIAEQRQRIGARDLFNGICSLHHPGKR